MAKRPPKVVGQAAVKRSGKRVARSQGPRVNLTLTPELDALLTRFSQATGTGKASFVTQLLTDMLPQLHQMATAVEMAAAGNLDAFNVMARAAREALQQGEQAQLELKSARRRAARRKGKQA